MLVCQGASDTNQFIWAYGYAFMGYSSLHQMYEVLVTVEIIFIHIRMSPNWWWWGTSKPLSFYINRSPLLKLSHFPPAIALHLLMEHTHSHIVKTLQLYHAIVST